MDAKYEDGPMILQMRVGALPASAALLEALVQVLEHPAFEGLSAEERVLCAEHLLGLAKHSASGYAQATV